ncbi:MAG: hypothetical protein ACRD2B_12930 [Terriglobia bacterium]
MRASALKQFGLMGGNVSAYRATELAKEIDAALPDDRYALLRRAVLSSKLFNKIFDTFHGDSVSKAQIAKRAKELIVHPDSADDCAQLFIESAITAGLGTMDGESITLVNAGAVVTAAVDPGEGADAEEPEGEQQEAAAARAAAAAAAAKNNAGATDAAAGKRGNKHGLSVSLNVDSSSDPDKLEKQLKLLREYGVI